MINSKHFRERLTVFFFFRLAFVVWAALISAWFSPTSAQVNNGPQKKVLVLHLMRRNDTSTLASDRAFQKIFADGLAGRLDYYSEFVDLARFGGDDYQGALRDYFKQKYVGTEFDLIIATTDDLRDFLARYGAEVFPNTPVVFSSGDGTFENSAAPQTSPAFFIKRIC